MKKNSDKTKLNEDVDVQKDEFADMKPEKSDSSNKKKYFNKRNYDHCHVFRIVFHSPRVVQ